MIFPEEQRKVVEIRSTRVDHRAKQRNKSRLVWTVVFLLFAAAISLGVYFRVDEMIPGMIKSASSIIPGGDGAKKETPTPETEPSGTDLPPEDASAAVDTGAAVEEEPVEVQPPSATLVFTGDVLLSDYVLNNYDRDGIKGVVDAALLKKLKKADILEINNEFPFSTRGQKARDKQYTFRVDPKYVSVLKKMGVDVAGLANNHVLDFGKDALTDTFKTLDDAGIAYIGAGDSKERAMEAYTTEIDGFKIGIVASSRVIPEVSWDIRNQTPGVFTTYDPTNLISVIKETKKECDYVFVCVHWGREHTTKLVGYERNMAHQYIDAGADAVFGAHPHVVQGIESYKDRMIYYSLGNFIFNKDIERTFAVSMKITEDGITHKLIPASASGAKTSLLKGDDAKSVYSYVDGLSNTVTISDKGKVKAK